VNTSRKKEGGGTELACLSRMITPHSANENFTSAICEGQTMSAYDGRHWYGFEPYQFWRHRMTLEENDRQPRPDCNSPPISSSGSQRHWCTYPEMPSMILIAIFLDSEAPALSRGGREQERRFILDSTHGRNTAAFTKNALPMVAHPINRQR